MFSCTIFVTYKTIQNFPYCPSRSCRSRSRSLPLFLTRSSLSPTASLVRRRRPLLSLLVDPHCRCILLTSPHRRLDARPPSRLTTLILVAPRQRFEVKGCIFLRWRRAAGRRAAGSACAVLNIRAWRWICIWIGAARRIWSSGDAVAVPTVPPLSPSSRSGIWSSAGAAATGFEDGVVVLTVDVELQL